MVGWNYLWMVAWNITPLYYILNGHGYGWLEFPADGCMEYHTIKHHDAIKRREKVVISSSLEKLEPQYHTCLGF